MIITFCAFDTPPKHKSLLTNRGKEGFLDLVGEIVEHVDSLRGQGEIGTTLFLIRRQLPLFCLLLFLG